jgi:hypothetical protein
MLYTSLFNLSNGKWVYIGGHNQVREGYRISEASDSATRRIFYAIAAKSLATEAIALCAFALAAREPVKGQRMGSSAFRGSAGNPRLYTRMQSSSSASPLNSKYLRSVNRDSDPHIHIQWMEDNGIGIASFVIAH